MRQEVFKEKAEPQLSIFDQVEEETEVGIFKDIATKIREIEVESMTPLEALNLLSDLSKKLR